MKIGDKIPEMLGIDTDGREVKASDYTGKKLVIYFYPKDSTPGCTAEACSLRDGYSELLRAGYAISPALAPFVETHPLSDVNRVFDAVHHRAIRKRAVMVPA